MYWFRTFTYIPVQHRYIHEKVLIFQAILYTLTRFTARAEKSHACTKMLGNSASNGNTVFPVPHPTCYTTIQSHNLKSWPFTTPFSSTKVYSHDYPPQNFNVAILTTQKERNHFKEIIVLQVTITNAYLQNYTFTICMPVVNILQIEIKWIFMPTAHDWRMTNALYEKQRRNSRECRNYGLLWFMQIAT